MTMDKDNEKFGIIAAGPIVAEEGMEPRRVVLRQNVTNAAYVVHTQGYNVETGHVSFSHGSYFLNPAARPKAMAKFCEMVMGLDREAHDALYDIDM